MRAVVWTAALLLIAFPLRVTPTDRIKGPTLLDLAFVEKFRETLLEKDGHALEMSLGVGPKTDAIKDELRLLAAEGLAHADRGLSAQIVQMEVAMRAPGTPQSAWALFALDRLAQDFELDDSALEDMAYGYGAAVDGESERSMLSLYRAKALARRGYIEWASKELGRVAVASRWHADRLFEQGTDLVADDKAIEAEALYSEIIKRTNVRRSTKQFAELNRARIKFESGRYVEAAKAVKSLDLPMRERARALVEMAWSRYYLKEYGKALGLLRVADSAFFATLRSPEIDVLRMIISRDLCRFDLVKAAAFEFRERYKKLSKQIDLRLSIDTDLQLKQMALQGRQLQKKATLIHRLRTERKLLEDEDLKILGGLREMLSKNLTTLERKAEAEIARLLPTELERAASQLVDFREQVFALEREASVKKQAEAVHSDATEGSDDANAGKIQWPIGDESWWDELDSYEILVRSRCAPAPKDSRGQNK